MAAWSGRQGWRADEGIIAARGTGRRRHGARSLAITAGGNGSRVRLRTRELQDLANELGIDQRAKPLVSHRVIGAPISASTIETGLAVQCALDTTRDPQRIVVTDQQIDQPNIVRNQLRAERSYPTRCQNTTDRAIDS